MRDFLELIRWWEPLLIAAAVLAVVFEKKLIRFEHALPGMLRTLCGHAATFWRGEDLRHTGD